MLVQYDCFNMGETDSETTKKYSFGVVNISGMKISR
jgi:hypothetical protein